jgi:hypothetical protein
MYRQAFDTPNGVCALPAPAGSIADGFGPGAQPGGFSDMRGVYLDTFA